MGTDNAVIFGHQRSGNHWLAALVAKNIYGRNGYIDLLATDHNHRPYAEKLIYITRDWRAVLPSVFAMRDRFGLDVNDYGTFFDTRYYEMYRPRGCKCMVDMIVCQQVVTECSTSFAMIDKTPLEWYQYHNQNLCGGLVVKYERLFRNLRAELERIAEYLGRQLLSCEPIAQKVGWWPIKEKPDGPSDHY